MRTVLRVVLTTAVLAAVAGPKADAAAQKDRRTAPAANEENFCVMCHSVDESSETYVSEEHLAGDVHWQRGLRCVDCHGGNPTADDPNDAHLPEDGFRDIKTPADIPAFCGHCHSNIQYMRRYDPSARTDQEAEYWTSGHGQVLKEAATEHEKALQEHKEKGGKGEPPAFKDLHVATCIDCHSRHGIRAVNDQQSPVYPTRVAETCAVCHADAKLMAGRTYHGRPLGHDQYESWQRSVHGKAMLERGDLSAPTCNDCHGNHGAVPPDVASVAYACGACHGKVAGLFEKTMMKHRFEEEEENLPGCATCHGSLDEKGGLNVHDIQPPSDQMLGMASGAVCTRCHKEGEQNIYGATPAGAETARAMREGLDKLSQEIQQAKEKVEQAERLGMEVSGPMFDLRAAFDARTNARASVHSFSKDQVNEALAEGFRVTSDVKEKAENALKDYTKRRVWLAASLLPILLVIVLLVLYIRTLPAPTQ